MRKFLTVLLLILPALVAGAEYTPYIHNFSVWGSLGTDDEKLHFLIGVTNGYFVQSGEQELYHCLSNHVSYEQAVAMVNKYYKANPEKWNESAATAILEALTVEDGPCPKLLK